MMLFMFFYPCVFAGTWPFAWNLWRCLTSWSTNSVRCRPSWKSKPGPFKTLSTWISPRWSTTAPSWTRLTIVRVSDLNSKCFTNWFYKRFHSKFETCLQDLLYLIKSSSIRFARFPIELCLQDLSFQFLNFKIGVIPTFAKFPENLPKSFFSPSDHEAEPAGEEQGRTWKSFAACSWQGKERRQFEGGVRQQESEEAQDWLSSVLYMDFWSWSWNHDLNLYGMLGVAA